MRCIAGWIATPSSSVRVLDVFGQRYHWSLMQVEYSTDLIFRSEATLKPLYEQLAREAVLAVKSEKWPVSSQENHPGAGAGGRQPLRHPHRGHLRIKHRFGKTGVKMYDKFGRVLRLETTTQRRFLLQAPPQGGASRRSCQRTGRAEEVDLQPDRSARDSAGL